MARLATSGAEVRDHPTSDIGSPDGFAAGAAMCTTELTKVRSGSAALKCAGTSSNTCFRVFPFATITSGNQGYGRVYFQTDALPSATVKIASLVTAADGALISARLKSDGMFQLWNDVAGTQIGSDTALVVEVDRWYRLQLRLKIAAGAADEAELLIRSDDYQSVDESVSGASLTVSDTHTSRLRAGWIDAPGVTANMILDDVAVNDSTGTKQTTFPGDGHVVLSPTLALSSAGSWTDCSGGANPQDGTNKLPPVGLTDHTTAGHTGANAHQARVAANTAQTLTVRAKAFTSVGFPSKIFGAASGSGSNAVGSTSSNQSRAASFQVGTQQGILRLTLGLGKTGTPTDDLIVEIQSDSSGAPSGTVLGSATFPLTSSVGSRTPISLPTTPVQPGTNWIVVSRSGAVDASNFPYWIGAISTTYFEGDELVYNGTSWSSAGLSGHQFTVEFAENARLKVVAPVACHGEATTGVKGGTVTGISPTSAAKAFNFGDNVGVAGTYPSNWRWVVGTVVYDSTPTPTAGPAITLVKNSGSGAGNPVNACFLGVLAEYAVISEGWLRWQKTSDSSFWWAKYATQTIQFERSDLTVLEVEGGDWAIYPEPQLTEGQDFPTTLTFISDSVLQSTYTLA